MRRMAWAAALALAACSSSLGSQAFDLPPEGVTAPIACADSTDARPSTPCPNHVYVQGDTAVAILADVKPVASGAVGSVRWTGRFQGEGIPRKGGTASATAGWLLSFCGGTSVIFVDTTGGNCRAANRCDCQGGACEGVDCATLPDLAAPAVDSDAAIQAAFPSDAAGTTYTLALDLVKASAWTVTLEGANPSTVTVDSATGSAK